MYFPTPEMALALVRNLMPLVPQGIPPPPFIPGGSCGTTTALCARVCQLWGAFPPADQCTATIDVAVLRTHSDEKIHPLDGGSYGDVSGCEKWHTVEKKNQQP